MDQTLKYWSDTRIEETMGRFFKEAVGDGAFFERIAPVLGLDLELLRAQPVVERNRERRVCVGAGR